MMEIREALRIIEKEMDKASRTYNAMQPSGRRNATALKELIEAYETVIIEIEKSSHY